MNILFSRIIFLLFLLIPVVFIGTDYPTIFAPFVVPGYHYESIKVLVFFFLGTLLCIVSLLNWRERGDMSRFSHSVLLGTTLLMMSIIFSILFSDFPIETLWGSPERRHGAIFYGSLICFYLLLRQSMSAEVKKMGEWGILASFILLAGYAFFQMYGCIFPAFWDTLLVSYRAIFSTLGNSAYLAGYMLILLPWIREEKKSRVFQYTGGIVAIIVILATGSVSATILAIAYLLFVGFKKYQKSQTTEKIMKSLYSSFLLLLMVLLWGMVFFSESHPHLNTKIQNLETRLVIWHETLSVWKRDSVSMAFGNGADTLGNFLEPEWRSNMLRKYIPNDYSIDRAHNIFIDILFSFGILGFLTFLISVWMLLRHRISHPSVHVVLLFFAFFSFNIPVISHWLLFIFALSTAKMKG